MKNVFYSSADECSHSSETETDSDDDSPSGIEDKTMWKLINSATLGTATEIANGCDDDGRNLERGVYNDVLVMVNSDVYELDRVILALKSDYFEKLFTANFNNKESELLEIHTIDSRTFSTIIDIMYDDDVETFLSIDNFATLLLAMDYLQMEIDLKVFRDFLNRNLTTTLLLYADVFKFLKSHADNQNFEYLLPTIYQYCSLHLIEVLHFQDFFLLPVEVLVKIISKNRFPRYTSEKSKIGLICTEWICKDIENRLIHMTALVNAAKYRYGFHFKLDGRSMNAQFLLDIDKPTKQKKEMERYFTNLMNQDGQIDPAQEESRADNANAPPVDSVVNKIDVNAKWRSFLENRYFCDITVKVGEKTYELHRWKLGSCTNYFDKDEDEETPKTLNNDADFKLEDIDELTFEAIIEFIYFNRIDFESNVKIGDLLKASKSLGMSDLTYVCKTEITAYLDTTRISNEFIKTLNFIVDKDDCKDLCVVFREHIISSWPKIGTLPEFWTISRATLESILMLDKLEINHPDEILDICAKWIAHDAQNRYHLLPRIANTICHNHLINRYSQVDYPANWNDCSEQFVKDKLWEILSSISSTISGNRLQNEQELGRQPAFIAPVKENAGLFDILDFEFNEITTVHSFQSACCDRPSAALINDNLFMLFKIKKKFLFQVYNLSTKKFFSLAPFDRLIKMNDQQLTLLNCNNELFCCCENGTILKYSAVLNRWMMVVKNVVGRDRMMFTSNGKKLFRFSRQTQTRVLMYGAETYDFQRNSWIPLPKISPRLHRLHFSRFCPISVTAVNDDLSISFISDIVSFNHQQQSWYDVEICIPNLTGHSRDYGASILTHREGNVLCMRDKKIWTVSRADGRTTSNQRILPDKYATSIVAIHHVRP